jgi:hypothetical protein
MAGFFEGGAKSLSFGERGSQEAAAVFSKWRGGLIVNIGEARQKTDWKTREPKFWPNSQDPVMQLPITLDTWEGGAGRCPEPAIDDEDDGVRDYYITKGQQDFQAARNALKKAGAKDFAAGGKLYVRWHKGEGKQGDPRQFEMIYEPPTQTSAGFLDDGPGAGPPSMPPQVPAQQHPSEVIAAAGGPPAQGFPAQQPAAAPPQPVFNQATGQWELPAPAAPAAPPQPIFNQATGQWELPGAAPAGPPAAGVTNPWKR